MDDFYVFFLQFLWIYFQKKKRKYLSLKNSIFFSKWIDFRKKLIILYDDVLKKSFVRICKDQGWIGWSFSFRENVFSILTKP